MAPDKFPRNVDVDTDVLKVKSKIQELKESCGELQDQDERIVCFGQAQEMEKNLEQFLRENRAEQLPREKGYIDLDPEQNTAERRRVEDVNFPPSKTAEEIIRDTPG